MGHSMNSKQFLVEAQYAGYLATASSTMIFVNTCTQKSTHQKIGQKKSNQKLKKILPNINPITVCLLYNIIKL